MFPFIDDQDLKEKKKMNMLERKNVVVIWFKRCCITSSWLTHHNAPNSLNYPVELSIRVEALRPLRTRVVRTVDIAVTRCWSLIGSQRGGRPAASRHTNTSEGVGGVQSSADDESQSWNHGRFTFKVVLANAPLPDAFFGRAEGSGLSASHQLLVMRSHRGS